MGHFTTIYGYITVHHTKKDATDKYITSSKEIGNLVASMIFGPFDCFQSGMCTYAICGELKEYIDTDANEFIEKFSEYLNDISGVYSVLQFDSELSVYPDKIEFEFNEEAGWITA